MADKIVLRDYQEKALESIRSRIKAGQDKVVLSICPGGGKTFTAINFMLENSQYKKILVLAHGTNVLKNQWVGELSKLGISHSTDLDSSERVIVTIPQNTENKTLPKFDLVVIDEAHEFYFAKTVQNVIKKTRPKFQLLLTGTPSRFIRRGIEPIIVSAGDVYKAGYLHDINAVLVQSKYEIKDTDYNSTTSHVKNEVKFTEKSTRDSFNNLVLEMMDRLKMGNSIKKSSNAANLIGRTPLKSYSSVFSKLEKTLIAAKDVDQAHHIYKLLKKQGVSVLMSVSRTEKSAKNNVPYDLKSENVQKFLDDKSVQVLVVVFRGVLGFNMPELVNVVDFTMSRNIDRVYQLMARALRVCEGINHKYYFRLCNSYFADMDKLVVSGAMALGSKHFMSKFNGTNLKLLKVTFTKKARNKSGGGSGSRSPNPPPPKMDEDLSSLLKSIEIYDDLIVNGSKSKYIKDYAMTTYGKAMAEITGKNFVRKIKNITEENLLYMIRTGKVDERIYV